ncbi:hypothetical protein N7536_009775 [Penicillium majusculum]|nr:hypothetical protein N7536_009775 [Penicillium majusculum]
MDPLTNVISILSLNNGGLAEWSKAIEYYPQLEINSVRGRMFESCSRRALYFLHSLAVERQKRTFLTKRHIK